MRFLALLLLTGCATSPATFERGTPASPPPAPLRPGVGAPVMGQPGAFAAPLPRSPNVRILPPSKEPGLWSADRPRAAVEADGTLTVLGVEMPSLEDDIPDDVRIHEINCARTLDDTTKFERMRAALARLSDAEHECLAINAHVNCLRAVERIIGTESPERQQELDALRRLIAHIDDIKSVLCGSVAARSRTLYDAETVLMTLWANRLRPWWRKQ